MLAIISPAKSLDFGPYNCGIQPNIPIFKEQTNELIEICRSLTQKEIAKIMSISPKLAELNFIRFQNYSKDYNHSNSKPAILAYNGDVYDSIDKANYNDDHFEFANKSLRIISGLYGILKPLDLIQPYRLEMSTALKNSHGANLYKYWQNIVTENLNNELLHHKHQVIVNLASKEYSDVINTNKLKFNIINIVFKERKDNDYKIIGIFSKKARGKMADFIIKNKIVNPEDLKNFKNHYLYSEKLSNEENWVYISN